MGVLLIKVHCSHTVIPVELWGLSLYLSVFFCPYLLFLFLSFPVCARFFLFGYACVCLTGTSLAQVMENYQKYLKCKVCARAVCVGCGKTWAKLSFDNAKMKIHDRCCKEDRLSKAGVYERQAALYRGN